MACSVCRRNGHKKPNCPIIKEEKELQTERLITILQTIPLILSNPLFIAFIWFHLSKMNPSINALNSVIALAEIVPTVDLSLPEGVVLGAMVEKSDDVIETWNQYNPENFIDESVEFFAEGTEYWIDKIRSVFGGKLVP